MEHYGKLSRLYRPDALTVGAIIALDDAQSHYLKNVLRKEAGDTVRIFNGKDGEFTATLSTLSKKGGAVTINQKIREQPAAPAPLHLLFAPIKKNRLDFLIEKATELGVTHLHPVITARTENRNLNHDRLAAQILEAAEQCERMDIPALAPALSLKDTLAKWDKSIPLCWCNERSGAASLKPATGNAFLIGPEGGFDDTETALLEKQDFVKSISLGETIYRAETAALLCLASPYFRG